MCTYLQGGLAGRDFEWRDMARMCLDRGLLVQMSMSQWFCVQRGSSHPAVQWRDFGRIALMSRGFRSPGNQQIYDEKGYAGSRAGIGPGVCVAPVCLFLDCPPDSG